MADGKHQGRMTAPATGLIDELIFNRRSIRRYKSDVLPESWIREMLACAHQAPSPSNSQPVRFVRIVSQACRDRLQQALSAGHERLLAEHRDLGAPARLRNWINAYYRYAEFMVAAPVLLAVGLDTGVHGFADRLSDAGLTAANRFPGSEMDITIGLALQGMMLKAQALGIGSCVLTSPLFFIQDVDAVIGIEQVAVKCFVTLGFADEAPPAGQRRPLADVVEEV